MDDSWGYAGIAIACAFSPTPGQGCPTAAARLQGCKAARLLGRIPAQPGSPSWLVARLRTVFIGMTAADAILPR